MLFCLSTIKLPQEIQLDISQRFKERRLNYALNLRRFGWGVIEVAKSMQGALFISELMMLCDLCFIHPVKQESVVFYFGT